MSIQKSGMALKGQLVHLRSLHSSAQRAQQVAALLHEAAGEAQARTDEQWLNAKAYDSMPGPSKFELFRFFLPGGELHNSNLIEMNKFLHKRYGDIFRVKGTFGKVDTIFSYDPADFEITFRNEGAWPLRIGLETFTYYRQVKRPDIFKGIGGLISEQGKAWGDIRNKVNPILMKVQNVRQNLPEIDKISSEFLNRIEQLHDPKTNELKNNFIDEIKLWAFESVCYVALNTRMGLLSGNSDKRAIQLSENMADFFDNAYEYDVAPSFWKYIETPGFKRLLKNYDNITEITSSYIDAAMKKFEAENNREAKSVLEKLYRIDRTVAIVMAMDMLMAGMDTTSSTFITTLYFIATNPDKQENLRQEVKKILPHPNTPLTEENTKTMPYLRACIKEALRIRPIAPSNFRVTIKDLVLSGYQVPRGTGVVMDCMALSNMDKYFPRSKEYLPERWLKSGEMACPAAKNSNPFVYLPFGFGPRTCIGKRLAEMEMETLIAKLIRNYKVGWNSEEPPTYKSTIIAIPVGNTPFTFEKI